MAGEAGGPKFLLPLLLTSEPSKRHFNYGICDSAGEGWPSSLLRLKA